MTDIQALATKLLRLPSSARGAALRAAGDIDVVLRALADEVDRLAVGEVSQALEVSELVVALADEVGGAAVRAQTQRARAQALGYAGRFDEALPVYDRAATLATEAGETLEAAHSRMSSLHALASLGRYADAIAAGEAARTAFEAAGESVQAARADVNLGATYQMCDRPNDAIRHFDRARPRFADDALTLAKIDSNRGHAYLGMDAFAEAERAYEAARPTFEQHNLSWASAIVEGNLAELATRQGRLQSAFYHFERARRHLERDETPADLARIMAEHADALATLGLLDEALAGYRAALPQLETAGLASEAVRAKAGIGRVLVRLGRDAEATALLDEAAAGFEALVHATPRARLDVLRAALLMNRGQLDDAATLLRSAVATLHERPADLAAARYHLVRCALVAGDVDVAERELSQALVAAERLQIAPLLADLLHTRARLHRARGDHAAAWIDVQGAIQHAERVRGTLQADRFRAAFHGERMALYQDAVVFALERGGPTAAADAFAAVERAKSRSLLDMLRGAIELGDNELDADPASAELTVALNAHRRTLNGLYSRLADSALGDSARTAPERLHDQIRTHEHALAQIEARLASARGAAALFAPPLDATAAARTIPGGTALIEYFVADDELLALVLCDGQVQGFRHLAGAATLADGVRRFFFQIRRALRPGATDGPRGARLVEDARRELAGLYDTLMAPLRDALHNTTALVVVPHGPLHAVPFAALWNGRAYLMETHEVTSTPSASVYARCRAMAAEPRTAHGAVVAGVADDIAPHIAAELDAVAQTLGAEIVLKNADATAARLSDALRSAAIAHIACHGHFSAENPLASGLKLADRWLTVRDVYGLRLRSALVTLSGCETGRAVVASGDELVGLSRAFFAAGASGLLVSLWVVNDASTRELMTSFYRIWRGGGQFSAAAAFREAQRTLAATRPHPAFWAPFVMMGEA